MSSTRPALFVLAAVASIGVALACGPDFPWQLFDSRASTVRAPVELSFAFEIKRLAPTRSDNFVAVEPDEFYDPQNPEVAAAERQEAQSGIWTSILPAETTLSTSRLLWKLEAARRAENGKEALIAGEGLPVAVLDYIAGAIEFRAGQLDTAKKYFEAIDRLPPPLRQIRTVAAAYMLGRIQQLEGRLDDARNSFQTVRARARAGAPDPLGLAVASLGEEARIDLVEAGLQKVPWNVPKLDILDAKAGTLIGRAVRLYFEQAARGSKIGFLSLREVAGLLANNHRNSLTHAIPDPLVRQLLVAYVVSRDYEFSLTDQLISTGILVDSQDQATSVIDAVLTQPNPAGDDLDRLAALAYQVARYDLAEKLTATTERPLGLWVRAKLALRRNDRDAAVRDWTAALNATVGAAKLDDDSNARLRGETTVMIVSEGRYVDSLRMLFPVAQTYWGDVAYIAERVLTTDELKAFVDELPPADPNAPAKAFDYYGLTGTPLTSLRDLLARRLVREGRLQDAQPYFSTTAPEMAPDSPSPAVTARAYSEAIEAARQTWPWQNISQAKAMFTAAMLARKHGMEIMGTEGPPDETAIGGAREYGIGQHSPVPEGQLPQEEQGTTPYNSASLLGPDEEDRFASSAPDPDVRYHYRLIAADHAVAAADLLPQRSQAYAATLCWAARFATQGNDQPRAERIYRRYVETGAYQPWAKSFGGTCPAPDFETARTFWPRRISTWSMKVVDMARRHAVIVGVGALAGLLLLAGAIRMVRSRRASPAA